MKTYEPMGARGEIIAYTAHPLVVERSYPDRVLCRDRLRCKLPQPFSAYSWGFLVNSPILYSTFSLSQKS